MIMGRQSFVLTLLTLTALAIAGCSTTANGNYRDVARDVRGAMQASTLGPGDVISVRVYLHKDLKGEYELSPVGQINFRFGDTQKGMFIVAHQFFRFR